MNSKMYEPKPTISVLMPTYNVANYVGEAIDSVLQQTFDDFELIIVDDCSTDDTYRIVKDYANRDSRIRVVRNDKNSKIVHSLNRGFELSRGDFIVRMDGDDISVNNRFQILLDYLKTHPSYDLVGSYSIAIDSSGNELARRMLPVSDRWIVRTLKYCSTVQHIWIARREVYVTLNGYHNYPGAEDYDFLLRAHASGYKLGNCPRYLYKVRLREGNTESTSGLYRVLTKQHVWNVNKQNNCVAEEVSPSDKDLERYRRASVLLDRAKHERDKPIMLIIDSLRAALSSPYMMRYLFEVIIVRWSVLIEKLLEEDTK